MVAPKITPLVSHGGPGDSDFGAQVLWRGLPSDPIAGSAEFENVFMGSLRPKIAGIAEKLIETIRDSEDYLPAPEDVHAPNYRDEPWGEETGERLKPSLRAVPVQAPGGVMFSIEGDVPWWESIEYGFIHNKSGKFIPGAHFIERAIAGENVSTEMWWAAVGSFHLASRAVNRLKGGKAMTILQATAADANTMFMTEQSDDAISLSTNQIMD